MRKTQRAKSYPPSFIFIKLNFSCKTQNKRKPKIQPSEFKDLTDSIQQFMNCITSHLANRKELFQGAIQSGRLLQKWGATKRLLAKEQKGLFQARLPHYCNPENSRLV